MSEIKPGDIVGRKSYGSDILFQVVKVYEIRKEKYALLKGIDVRLQADAHVRDLELKSPTEILKYRHRVIERYSECMREILIERGMKRGTAAHRILESEEKKSDFFELPGRVIHIDGDESYLEKCMRSYMRLEVEARGFFVPEEEQPGKIEDILLHHNASILVLTGHDGIKKGISDFSDLNKYRTSKYFVEAVKIARQLVPSRDELVIFAGACQSHYEALLEAGANFASSPQRVLIHAYDPVFVVEKVAYTPFNEVLSLKDVIKNTITGEDGIGGIETRGQFRWGYPKSPY